MTPIYQRIAEKVEQLISAGTFRPGDRLPSVRELSRDWRVSVTTAVGAYGLLEDRGLVEPRPRSGYYVRPRSISPGQVPRTHPEVASAPVEVSTAEITERVMDAVASPGVVPFGAAVPSDEAFPAAKLASMFTAAIRESGAAAFRYSMPPGLPELRLQLAKRLLQSGIAVSPDEIITTSGAMDAIALALQSCCRAGDVVVVESPTYFGVLNLVRELELKVMEVPVLAGRGVCADSLEKAFAEHPVRACILQPNFHNPVGSVIPDGEKKKIVALARTHGVTVIEDDLYGDLHYSGIRRSALKAFDEEDTVIHCGSYSKAFAPGLRVGWILPGSRFHRIKQLKYAFSLASSTTSELALARFLRSGGVDRHLRRVRRLYGQQTHAIREALLETFPEGLRVTHPEGGFLLWCELPPPFDSETFALEAFRRKISVVPGTIFSASCGLRNCFRISCGFPLDEPAQRALGVLGEIAARQMERRKG